MYSVAELRSERTRMPSSRSAGRATLSFSAVVGGHRHEALQQRAEGGLLAIGERPVLGGHGIAALASTGIVADGEDGLSAAGAGAAAAAHGRASGRDPRRRAAVAPQRIATSDGPKISGIDQSA